MNIYEKAVKVWGIDAQKDMVVEECAELINAIIKYRRGRVGIEQVVEECVDVEIMLNQMKEYYNTALWESTKSRKLLKLERLLERHNA